MTTEEHWESRLIIQIDRLAGVQKQLTSQLVTARVHEELIMAYQGLRDIADKLAAITKDMP